MGFDAFGVAMSLAVGAPSSCSKDMGLDENKESSDKDASLEANNGEGKVATHNRTMSETSNYGTEEEDEEEEGKVAKLIDLGPQFSLRQHIEKDKVLFILLFFLFSPFS